MSDGRRIKNYRGIKPSVLATADGQKIINIGATKSLDLTGSSIKLLRGIEQYDYMLMIFMFQLGVWSNVKLYGAIKAINSRTNLNRKTQ